MESMGVRRDVTRAFPLTVRVPPRPRQHHRSIPSRFRGLAGRRAYGVVQSGFLQPLCFRPTRMPLPSVHHQFRIILVNSPKVMTLIWTLPPTSTVPELRLTWPLSSFCTFANVLAGF